MIPVFWKSGINVFKEILQMQKSERFLKLTENCEAVSSLKFNAFIMNAGMQVGFNSSGVITIRFEKMFKQSIHELILRGYASLGLTV